MKKTITIFHERVLALNLGLDLIDAVILTWIFNNLTELENHKNHKGFYRVPTQSIIDDVPIINRNNKAIRNRIWMMEDYGIFECKVAHSGILVKPLELFKKLFR